MFTLRDTKRAFLPDLCRDRYGFPHLPREEDTHPVAGRLLVPVLMELHRWIHCRVELLADRHANRRRPGVENTPELARREKLHGALEGLPRLDGGPRHLVGVLKPCG